MDEIWELVFDNIQTDALATVRLMLAHRHLYYKYRDDQSMWMSLETLLPHPSRYMAYKAVNKHMGVARRVISWATYCDSVCCICNVDLYGKCSGTFALRVKLCYPCKCKILISEEEVCLLGMPPLPPSIRYCWLPHGPKHRNVKHYLRKEVLRLFNFV